MSNSPEDNLSAARSDLLSLTCKLALSIEQRAAIVRDIQQIKNTQPATNQPLYPAWGPQREHFVFKTLLEQHPHLSDSSLKILSFMIEIQVQESQGEASYPGFSQGEHLLNQGFNKSSLLLINPILAKYFRPKLYQQKQLKDWAQSALNC